MSSIKTTFSKLLVLSLFSFTLAAVYRDQRTSPVAREGPEVANNVNDGPPMPKAGPPPDVSGSGVNDGPPMPKDSISAPSEQSQVERIVGGTEADKNEYPFMVNLKYPGAGHFCGGSIYNKNWVLTAAHCIKDDFVQTEVRMIFGDWHQRKKETPDPEQKQFVAQAIRHPKYEVVTNEYDIGLLKIPHALDYSDAIQPIRLATSDPEGGEMCTAIGWGVTRNTGAQTFLREITVPIVSEQNCTQEGWIHPYFLYDGMICAGYAEGLKDVCGGDSGGPLLCKDENDEWELSGIISWGYDCAQPNSPAVYWGVAALNMKGWIDETIAANS